MPGDRDDFATRLLAHFDAHRRDLPWRVPGARTRRDPYAVLVSEAMLQQTRVRTVQRHFPEWLARFPDLATLARAERDDVLRAWEGLGYYRRAHALHRAAGALEEHHDGEVPADPDVLRALPGIGPYTAAAIAAFAFDRRVVAVDANVRRLACRLSGHRDAPNDGALAEELLARGPAARHGDYAEALVELGATVCTARSPSCQRCPVRSCCRAHATGPEGFPRSRQKRRPPTRERYAWVIRRADGVLLERRRGGMLEGLWGFPQHECPPTPTGAFDRDGAHARDAVHVAAPGDRQACQRLPEIRHAYTHFRLVLTPCLTDERMIAPTESPREMPGEHAPERRFAPWHQLPALAMSVLDRKVVAALVRHGHAPAWAIAVGGAEAAASRHRAAPPERGGA
ncbi:MAG: NUDIX domain-containing protein [Trueperaceae bacterium]